MKIVRYQHNGSGRYGLLENDYIYEIKGNVYSGDFEKGPPVGGIEAIALLPPCEPTNILSIGANYVSRCKENNLPIPTEPGKGDFFVIPVEALTGPGGLIYVPEQEVRVEYSGELAMVIRRDCYQISEEEALDHVLGYTIVHNVWAKDPKGATHNPPKKRIRAYESFCPTGPWIVTDVDPMNIAWETRVNGEVRQKANTSQMLFNIAEMVSHTSVRYPLKAGDLIQCGTASGVGTMKPGDTFEIEFEGIGVLRNLAVAGKGMAPGNLIRDEYEGD